MKSRLGGKTQGRTQESRRATLVIPHAWLQVCAALGKREAALLCPLPGPTVPAPPYALLHEAVPTRPPRLLLSTCFGPSSAPLAFPSCPREPLRGSAGSPLPGRSSPSLVPGRHPPCSSHEPHLRAESGFALRPLWLCLPFFSFCFCGFH